jgi:hypothetical protein
MLLIENSVQPNHDNIDRVLFITMHVNYDQKSSTTHFSDDGGARLGIPMALHPEAVLLQQEIERDLSRPRELTDTEIHDIITAREMLEMSWGLIALKLHHQKSTPKSAYKR